jgi:hypothetical protein
VAKLPSCRDGDVFAVQNAEYDEETPKLSEPGLTVYIDPSYDGDSSAAAAVAWNLPRDIKKAGARNSPSGDWEREGLLVTPSALPAQAAPAVTGQIYLKLDPSVPDAHEYVRNTLAGINVFAQPMTYTPSEQARRFNSIRTGLFVGAACVLALIGASLLVSQLEQLRERKKLLSALVAFGTRRRTLSLSVLWQTAIPIALGLALASAVGLTLGAVLLKMTDTSVTVDWLSVLSMMGIGVAVVLLVTALSVPPLLRLMRPDGLRTE